MGPSPSSSAWSSLWTCRVFLATSRGCLETVIIKTSQFLCTHSKAQAFKMDQLCIIDDGHYRSPILVSFPQCLCKSLMALRSLGPAVNAWTAVQRWLAQSGGPESGPTLVDTNWNPPWFQWAWAQVTSTYTKLIFIAVEVYSNLVKYLQKYAALSLLAVCSCLLNPSVKSGFLSFPTWFPTLLPSKLHWTFHPSHQNWWGTLYKEKCHCFNYWINNLMWILLLYF